MEEFVDEFIIDIEKVQLIETLKDRIENVFNVVLEKDGAKVREGGAPGTESKQWISLKGQRGNTDKAKEYVKALCNPTESMTIPYPNSLREMLTSPEIHGRLERQSKAAVIFPDDVDEAVIHGTELTVTLAVSALEDLIDKYQDTVMKEQGSYSISSFNRSSSVSERLNHQLKEAMSAREDIDLDTTQNETLNDAVKRVMLNWLNDEDQDQTIIVEMEDTQPSFNKSEDIHSITKDEFDVTTVMAMGGDDVIDSTIVASDSSLSPYNEDHFVTVDETGILGQDTISYQSFRSGQSQGHADKSQHLKMSLPSSGSEIKTDSVFLSLEPLGSTTSPTKSKIERTVSQPQSYGLPDVALFDSEPRGPSPTTIDEHKISVYYTTAERIGYTRQDVDSVVESFGTLLTTSEFIKALKTQKVGVSDAPSCSTPLPNEKTKSLFIPKETPIKTENEFGLSDMHSQVKPTVEHSPERDNVKTSMSSEERQNMLEAAYKSQRTSSDQVDEIPNQSQVRKADFTPERPKNKRKKKKKVNLPTDEPCRSRSPIDSRAEEIAATRETDDDLDGKYGRRATLQSTAGPSGSQWGSTSNQQQESLVPQLNSLRFHPYQALMPEPSQTVIRNSKDLRYIVIDGSNVAMAHGNNKEFSCKGIKIAVDYFLKRGHKDVTAFVPQFRQRGFNYRNPIKDQQILTDLQQKGLLVFTPSRKIDGRHQVCYDDKFIVQLAAETDGVIVSNDNYRDLMNQRPEWKHIIVNRLLMYSFVSDMFMLPDDPHGRNGPTLDQLLSKVPLHQLNRGNDPRGNQNQIPGIRSDKDLLAEQNRSKRFDSTPLTQYHPPRHADTNTRYMPMNQNTNRGGYGYRPPNNTQRYDTIDSAGAGSSRGAYRPLSSAKAFQTQGSILGHPPANLNSNISPGFILRTELETQQLFEMLKGIFLEEDAHRILANHPCEKNLNKLSSFLLDSQM